MTSIDKILNIIELGLKPDGTFYTNKDKAEMLWILFNEENKRAFDKGWQVGYNRGEMDDKTSSRW